jgi:type I restriction enzyme, R subunit
MNNIGKPERETQNRIIDLFHDELGYRYLGDRTDFENSNLWEEHPTHWLTKSGFSAPQIKHGRMWELLAGKVRLV